MCVRFSRARLVRPCSRLFVVGLVGALLAASTSGCFWVTTKREGEMLRADVKAIDERLAKREDDLEGKIQQLERVLAEATEVLRRNSADLGADVQELEQEIRKVQGLVSEAAGHADDVRAEVKALKDSHDKERAALEQRFTALEDRLAALEAQAAQPQTPEAMFTAAKAAYDGGDYAKAESLFRQLVTRYPGHDHADDSQYHRGEAYFRQKDYSAAIRELQKVYDKYPTSPLADDALFRAGEAAQALLRCTEARAYFGLIRQKYADSPLAKKSKDKDAEIKKDLKNSKKCAS
ncbi:MAG TPA: tetratricopeptide repeat protein [Haliangium sp.]|nr:tetratricopeptide repeat protein [Haliangium sp.]